MDWVGFGIDIFERKKHEQRPETKSYHAAESNRKIPLGTFDWDTNYCYFVKEHSSANYRSHVAFAEAN